MRSIVLLYLLCVNTGHGDATLHHRVVCGVCNRLLEVYKQQTQASQYRNFPNSLQHRHKHRAWAALLALQGLLDQSTQESLLDEVLQLMGCEAQTSVRCQMELFVLRAMLTCPQHVNKLWKLLGDGAQTKGSAVCSILMVLIHLLQSPSFELQEELLTTTLTRVVPWCMKSNFNIRIFVQTCLSVAWSQAQKRKLHSIMDEHKLVKNIIDFSMLDKNAKRTLDQLAANFMLQFNPTQDFSLEAIFLILPRLCGVTEEEWISPQMFGALAQTCNHATTQPQLVLPILCGSESKLNGCSPGYWRVKTYDTTDEDTNFTNVQKKIMPWRTMLPELTSDLAGDVDDFELSNHRRSIKQGGDGVILVTSLINKIPNLGGLCRTSEIFGVDEFVINSLEHVKDQGFKNLSVTAHKWVPITEVKAHQLKDYLIEKQLSGYSLVGVEQTANSVCLTQHHFHGKTLLLLGNEKEGIPPDLIQLLDVCVEIPQQGIIRSLNVHVSGALVIWEYTRQQLIAKQTKH